MICSLKEREPKKSIYQILFDFSVDFEDYCIDVFVQYMLKTKTIEFLNFSKSKGIVNIDDLIKVYDEAMNLFLCSDGYIDKIEECDKLNKSRVS